MGEENVEVNKYTSMKIHWGEKNIIMVTEVN